MCKEIHYEEEVIERLSRVDPKSKNEMATKKKARKASKNYLDIALENAKKFNEEFEGTFDGRNE